MPQQTYANQLAARFAALTLNDVDAKSRTAVKKLLTRTGRALVRIRPRDRRRRVLPWRRCVGILARHRRAGTGARRARSRLKRRK